ncbi:MAG: bifunctional DNA primase/polymerase [Actinomycetota bacterium]|nr:bifunctional DNA primase/polymerase [Actinomycetota bacterium]
MVYARRGWSVVPCHGPGHGGCSCCRADCSSPAKHPRVANGLKAATTDEDQIRQWWARWPSANVAVRTGAVSGMVVIDIDPDHGGEESLNRLVEQHGELPDGRAVRTGSGGRHLYFAHPGGVVRNDAGRRLGRGVDVRGDGGYVIAPPSRHACGRLYQPESRSRSLPQLPTWMLAELRPTRPEHRPSSARAAEGHGDTSAWAKSALSGEYQRLLEAPEGSRNHTLNRAAFRLGQIVGHGDLAEADVERVLLHGAAGIGLTEREAMATVRSGLEAGEQVPRGPAAGMRGAGREGVELGLP